MEREKHVDEGWKQSAESEKEKLAGAQEQPKQEAEPDQAPSQEAAEAQQEQASEAPQDIDISFLNYISSLAFQIMVFLGQVPNPMTNEPERNLQQAKLLIDTLVMLKEKTAGNLDKQEEEFLTASVYELQMRYVDEIKKEDQEKMS